MMTKYKILGIVISVIIIIITVVILSTGSMLIDSPVLVILATVDFIGTEQEFRDLVESTEEAKLFRKAFPDTTTQYYLEIGKRTIVFSNKINQYDTTMHFMQHFDRTLIISYWCDLGETTSFGVIKSVDELKATPCF